MSWGELTESVLSAVPFASSHACMHAVLKQPITSKYTSNSPALALTSISARLLNEFRISYNKPVKVRLTLVHYRKYTQ